MCFWTQMFSQCVGFLSVLSVCDFLVTLGITEQVARSWDLPTVPGGDAPAASGWSNQRGLTL